MCNTDQWIHSNIIIANSSLSPSIGDFYYFQDPNLHISFNALLGFETGNITGSPQGMQDTTISGATFSNDAQSSKIGHIFFQAQNGSIMEYALGLSIWVNLGEVPLG